MLEYEPLFLVEVLDLYCMSSRKTVKVEHWKTLAHVVSEVPGAIIRKTLSDNAYFHVLIAKVGASNLLHMCHRCNISKGIEISSPRIKARRCILISNPSTTLFVNSPWRIPCWLNFKLTTAFLLAQNVVYGVWVSWRGYISCEWVSSECRLS